jgi:hypothetical protein
MREKPLKRWAVVLTLTGVGLISHPIVRHSDWAKVTSARPPLSEATKEEIDDLALQCYQNGKYINTGLEGDEWPFKCPSCDYKFAKLSALYQHAEDVLPCSSLLSGNGCLAKLARFINRSLQ